MFRNNPNLKKALSVTTGLAGVAFESLETALFAGLLDDELLEQLFRPLGIAMMATVAPGPLLEEDKGKKIFRILSYIPTAAANTAIFAYEGPTAAAIFTVAMSITSGLFLTEIAYKKYHGETIDKAEVVIKLGKLGGIITTLTLGGVGEVLRMAKAGNVALGHKIAAGIAGGFAGVSSLMGLFKNAKTACSSPVSEPFDNALLEPLAPQP